MGIFEASFVPDASGRGGQLTCGAIIVGTLLQVVRVVALRFAEGNDHRVRNGIERCDKECIAKLTRSLRS